MAAFDPALGQYTAELDEFIPELWSNEIIAAHEQNLVLGSLVTFFEHQGQRGDVIHIPRPIRGAASAFVEGNSITLINTTETTVPINLDKFYDYSRLVGKLARVQAIPSYRQFYTNDAGEALARQIDTDIHTLGATLIDPKSPAGGAGTNYSKALIGSDGDTFWDPSANTNTGNGAALTDAGIRRMGRLLDDMNMPQSERYWVVPPVEKESLLGIPRFTEQAFVGEGGAGNSIRSGRIGMLYGSEVYVSSNCPTIQADDASTNYRVGLYFHRSSMALVNQLAINMDTAYRLEYKGDIMSADTVYGVGKLSTFITTGSAAVDGAIAFVVPA